jgi:hypothetical protein
LLPPPQRIWLQPSLKEPLFEQIDVEFGKESIIILPGAKKDIKYNGKYQIISVEVDLGRAEPYTKWILSQDIHKQVGTFIFYNDQV